MRPTALAVSPLLRELLIAYTGLDDRDVQRLLSATGVRGRIYRVSDGTAAPSFRLPEGLIFPWVIVAVIAVAGRAVPQVQGTAALPRIVRREGAGPITQIPPISPKGSIRRLRRLRRLGWDLAERRSAREH